MNYVNWEDIPIGTVHITECEHESCGIAFHLSFKTSEEWFNCASLPGACYSSQVPGYEKDWVAAKRYLPCWKQPGIIKRHH